jgi:predicted nucleic acid-binding protein
MHDVFLDTDVAFDIISKREPHYTDSVKLLQLAEGEKIKLIVAECGLTTLFYLTFESYKIENASIRLLNFLSACETAYGGKDVVLNALNSKFKDKEDALQYFTAMDAGAAYFISRNTGDYKNAIQALPVYTPAQFIQLLPSLAL